jgi:DNA-binding MarR family transcriptional regulator
MSALAVNETLDFIALKEFLNVTDGNLATHIKKLEKEGFIGVKKTFIDNKPNTRYSMTPDRKKAFGDYLNVMEEIIKAQK